MLRFGMARSFQKNQHPDANLKIQRTQKVAPLFKEGGLNNLPILLYPGAGRLARIFILNDQVFLHPL